jgi:hypothetical protein
VVPRTLTPCCVVALASLAILCGCRGGNESVLDEGRSVGVSGGRHKVGSDEATRSVGAALRSWNRELAKRASAAPAQRFDNLPVATLERRLQVLAAAHDFEVVTLQLNRPAQLAPRIVVRTTHYLELAKATPLILRRLDPKRATNDDRTGWRFEGFFFEARDEHGTPFLATFNFWRDGNGGGGQFARSERLYPFAHG